MRRIIAVVNGAAWVRGGLAELRRDPLPELERTNFRGRTVSLGGGVAAAVGTLAGTLSAGGRDATAGVVAVLPAAALGAWDDLGEAPEDRATKGLRGHLRALREGRLTTGAAKLAGITTAGLAAGAILAAGRGRLAGTGLLDAVTSGALVAGTANLVNLLDLRPGRALKVTAIVAAPLAVVGGPGSAVAAGVAGAAGGALPSDLAETTMLGDTGANALGAALGVALAAHPLPAVRLGALAVVVAGTLASEKVSFSAVIERTPALRALDGAGRLGA